MTAIQFHGGNLLCLAMQILCQPGALGPAENLHVSLGYDTITPISHNILSRASLSDLDLAHDARFVDTGAELSRSRRCANLYRWRDFEASGN